MSYLFSECKIIQLDARMFVRLSSILIGHVCKMLGHFSNRFSSAQNDFFRHTHTCRNNRFSSSVKFGEANYIKLKPSSSFRTFQSPLCSCFHVLNCYIYFFFCQGAVLV